jgi:thiamine-phosphate diphosphorylase
VTAGDPWGVPALHVLTDDAVLARPDFARQAAIVLTALGQRGALHLRGHRTSGRLLYQTASALMPVADAAGALLVLNDRIDIASAVRAPAVQVGPRSFTVADVRRIDPRLRVGYSVHAAGADVGDADWVIAGHVFATPSHAAEPARGLAFLRAVTAVSRVPVLAVGGVTLADVAAIRVTGAHGVAVIRGIWDATAAPGAAVQAYLDALSLYFDA